MPIHSTTFDHWQLVKKIRLTFADYIALVYGFSHHIAGTIYKAQEQHVSIALVLFCYFKKFFDFFLIRVTNHPSVLSVSAERGKKPFRFGNFNLKGGEIMKPSSFENAIRLQFDCLVRKVIGRTVKNYNKELARRAKHEISFCEIPTSWVYRTNTRLNLLPLMCSVQKFVSMMRNYVKQSKN